MNYQELTKKITTPGTRFSLTAASATDEFLDNLEKKIGPKAKTQKPVTGSTFVVVAADSFLKVFYVVKEDEDGHGFFMDSMKNLPIPPDSDTLRIDENGFTVTESLGGKSYLSFEFLEDLDTALAKAGVVDKPMSEEDMEKATRIFKKVQQEALDERIKMIIDSLGETIQ